MSAISPLALAHPWPFERPALTSPIENFGRLGGGADLMLARELSATTCLVVEVGPWLGMATRFIADLAPNATVIGLDHWQGSLELRGRPEWQDLLPRLYETFLSLNWSYRGRVIPLRMAPPEGLREVARHGLTPDLVFFHGEHSRAGLGDELALARELFPNTPFIGDNYNQPGIRVAVDQFAGRSGLGLVRVGEEGWKLVARETPTPVVASGPAWAKSVVLVPHLNGIVGDCELSLARLESAGVRVIRRVGSSQIDLARNEMISEVLHDGFESIFFIDADIGFDAADALRLLARPEPVISGVYAKKGRRGMASVFADGIEEVLFGPAAPGFYPLKYAATGFLRIRAEVLRRMVAILNLPLCNTKWGRGIWPFFYPLLVPIGTDGVHYLGEDWSFSHRLSQIGVTPMADTSIRLWHHGSYGYSWEDAGSDRLRYRSYNFRI